MEVSRHDEMMEDYVDCLMSLDTNHRSGGNDHSPLSLAADEATESRSRIFMLPDNKELITAGLVENKLEPTLGMEFESDEAAKTFYNEYARHLGFPFRVGRSRRSKAVQEVLIMKRFVCSKEGVYRKKPADEGTRKRERMSMREGCKAMMEVIRGSDRWVVSKLETEHNHNLGTCSRVGYHRARGFIDNCEKATIATSDVMMMLHPNAFGVGDVQGLLDYLKRMQAESLGFFYAVQVDNNSCMMNAFWADARARSSYSYFGDAVTFDMTYKKNKYMMPFVSFSGVNHHLQPVVFGCAFMMDESEFSFIWLFETWLRAMGGCPPVSLVTDQNKAMTAAIRKVFPNTCHRFCKWLILSRCKQKLALVYSEYSTFRAELEKCVIESETVEGFETGWVSIVDKYDLRMNTWLQLLFNIRHRWIPLYRKDIFFAEVSPTQKLETLNDFYKKHFNTKTSLKIFLTQFDLSMESRYESEVQADSITMFSKAVLKTASPIEKQAGDIYTRAIFEKFQEEFVESLGYNAYKIDDGTHTKFSVARDEDALQSFIVTYNAAKKTGSCSCKNFEFSGILCRHILVVFLMADIHAIPEELITKRWTKNAKADVPSEECINEAHSYQDSITARYNDLCRYAIKCAEKGAITSEMYKVAKDMLQKVFTEIVVSEKSANRDAQTDTININEEITVDETAEQPFHDPGQKVTNLLGQLLGSSWSLL